MSDAPTPPPPSEPSGRAMAAVPANVVFHGPGASVSGAKREAAPMPTPGQMAGVAIGVDSVISRAIGAVLIAAAATGVAWFVAGRDGVVTDNEKWWLVGAAVAGGVAVVFLVAMLSAAFIALGQISRAQGARFGRLRVAIVTVLTTVAVVVAGVATVPRSLDARKLIVDKQKVLEVKEKAAPIDPASAPIPLARLVKLPVGTCLRWQDGPTKADRLGDKADPSSIRSLDCRLPHGSEIIGIVDFPTATDLPYPDQSNRRKVLDNTCLLKLLAYLTAPGKPPVTTTRFDVYGLAPPEQSWIVDVRVGVCVAIPPNALTTVTSSLKGAGS